MSDECDCGTFAAECPECLADKLGPADPAKKGAELPPSEGVEPEPDEDLDDPS